MFMFITSWLTVTELMTLLMAGLGTVCNKSFRSLELLPSDPFRHCERYKGGSCSSPCFSEFQGCLVMRRSEI